MDIQPHIRCCSKDAAKYAIMPGDPERVERVKLFLENPVDLAYNREFKSCSGFFKGVKIMVVSTGIGGASTAIAVEELKNIGVETLIRIGSCGALQRNIKLGELIIAKGAVREDGTSEAYVDKAYPAMADPIVLMSLLESSKELNLTYHSGLIRSHDALYADGGSELEAYWRGKGVLGSDMETSALFVVGGIRNLRTASVLNVVVESEENLEQGINSYVKGENKTTIGERNEIITVLEAIVKLEKIFRG